MELKKFTVGPFEIFSGFISGLPFLLFAYIVWNGQFDFIIFLNKVIMNSSFSNFALFLVTSYLVGSMVAQISYRYFKYAGKLMGWDYLYMEKVLLGDWEQSFQELSADKFNV